MPAADYHTQNIRFSNSNNRMLADPLQSQALQLTDVQLYGARREDREYLFVAVNLLVFLRARTCQMHSGTCRARSIAAYAGRSWF
jgi:hypothetical protein